MSSTRTVSLRSPLLLQSLLMHVGAESASRAALTATRNRENGFSTPLAQPTDTPSPSEGQLG